MLNRIPSGNQNQFSISNKPFSLIPSIDLLSDFEKKLQSKNVIDSTITRTGSGSTGFTFLCRLNSERFVLKWQKRTACINEVFGNTLISVYGFNTPRTILLDERSIAWNLSEYALEERPDMPRGNSAKEQLLDLLVMPNIPGVNFELHLTTGEFWRLSTDLRLELFEQLGSIIPFDLLIGNHDRILRIQTALNNPLCFDQKDLSTYLLPDPLMNTGNVMIELKVSDTSREIIVHFIDSATYPMMLTPVLKVKDPDDSNFCPAMFKEEDEEYVSPQASSSPESRLQTDRDVKERFENLFKRLFREIFKEPDLFAVHAMQSICNSIKQAIQSLPALGRSMNGWEEELKKDSYSQAILSGIQSSCERLTRLNAREIQVELQKRYAELTTEEITAPDIFDQNLQVLNQFRTVNQPPSL